MTTRDEARDRLAAALLGQPDLIISGGMCLCTVRRDDLRALLSDHPRPSVSEDQGASRDHALTDSVALDGEHFGPWRVWFDPPPIGTRECDWHYQHEDAEPECPAWMHGHCASRDACIAEIIDGYEERA
jgi:hypothetical protein